MINGILGLLSFTFLLAGAAQEYHVSVTGDDRNKGNATNPLKTISAAAQLVQPGNTVIVHAGTYREWVKPARGGTSEDNRITYRAAEGEEVVIKGSEQITTWKDEGEGVWKVELPNSFFGDYNPYQRKIGWMSENWLRGGEWTHCGDVYLDGEAFYEKQTLNEVQEQSNTWHTEVDNEVTIIWANFGESNPNNDLAEINVRECVIFPEKTFLSYITVSGFTIMHSGSGWSPPTHYQGGAIGSNGGHHWVLENCTVINAKAIGFSMGIPTERTPLEVYDEVGHHIIRNNVFRRCGQSAIAGCRYNTASYIAGNHIGETSYRKEFWGAEPAGIKFHLGVDLVLENNYITGSNKVFALWIDYGNQNIRVTRNILGARLYIEMDHGPILVDNNVLLGGFLNRDSEAVIMAHNLLNFDDYEWTTDERTPMYYDPHTIREAGRIRSSYRDNKWYNNIFMAGGLASAKDDPGCDADYNVYLNGSSKSRWDENSVVSSFNPGFSLNEDDGVLTISFEMNEEPFDVQCPLLTTDYMGFFDVPKQGMENPDGTPITIDTDLLGKPRNKSNPVVGPFSELREGKNTFEVFSIADEGRKIRQ